MGLSGWTMLASVLAIGAADVVRADDPALAPVVEPVAAAVAAGPKAVRIELKSGDKLHGTVVSDAGPLIVEHAILGRLILPLDAIASITPVAPPTAATATPPTSGDPSPSVQKPEVQVVVEVSGGPPITGPTSAQPAPSPILAPQVDLRQPGLLDNWKLTFETGLTGSTGNLEQQNVRIRITGARSVPEMNTTGAVQWVHQQTEGEATQNHVQVDIRNDWAKGKESDFGFYIAGTGEYNEFAPWEFRVSGNGGLSFDVAKEDDLTIVARTGFGGSREFGAHAGDPRAEIWPGFELEYRLDERNKIGMSVVGSLNVEDIESSRASMKAWYETVLDPESQMSLRIGVEDRYESSPGLGREEHQVDYYAMIVFRF